MTQISQSLEELEKIQKESEIQERIDKFYPEVEKTI
jgi:hypothetical protein